MKLLETDLTQDVIFVDSSGREWTYDGYCLVGTDATLIFEVFALEALLHEEFTIKDYPHTTTLKGGADMTILEVAQVNKVDTNYIDSFGLIWRWDGHNLVSATHKTVLNEYSLLRLLTEITFLEDFDCADLEKDTLIWVSDNNNFDYVPQYFARFENRIVYCYASGRTSKTALNEDDVMGWTWAALTEPN